MAELTCVFCSGSGTIKGKVAEYDSKGNATGRTLEITRTCSMCGGEGKVSLPDKAANTPAPKETVAKNNLTGQFKSGINGKRPKNH